jgi:hypothetical protein
MTWLPFGLLGIAVCVHGQSLRLADICKTGRVRLVEEIRVTDAQLPDHAIFENPRGLAVDANGNVYVADAGADHIKVFGPDGKFLRMLGRRGEGPGELSGAGQIEIAGGHIIVFESMNLRISVLNLDGTFVRSGPLFPGAYGNIWKVMALPDGRPVVYVERGLPDDFRGQLPDYQILAVDVISEDLKITQTIYEKQLRSFRWARNPQENFFQRVRFPYHPTISVDVSAMGVIAVGLNEKYEIKLFRPDLQPFMVLSRAFTPVKCSEEDKKAFFERFRMAVFKDNKKTIVPNVPDFILKNTEFPEFLPPYRGLIFDSEGNLWVHLFMPSRETNIFDVFSPKGEFLQQIRVEGVPIDRSFALAVGLCFTGPFLWRIEHDADGFASLIKYRLTSGK